jgi:hypothetical protein
VLGASVNELSLFAKTSASLFCSYTKDAKENEMLVQGEGT